VPPFVEELMRLAFFGHVSIASEFFTGNFGAFWQPALAHRSMARVELARKSDPEIAGRPAKTSAGPWAPAYDYAAGEAAIDGGGEEQTRG
jgi:hypothetical protein